MQNLINPEIGIFHHVGVACRNLDAEQKIFGLLGYAAEGEDFEDPIQGVRGRFLTGGGPRIELLTALAPDSNNVLKDWLGRGAKMYHLAYVVDDIGEVTSRLVASGAKVIVPPVPAIAFNNSNISFVMLRNMLLVELIEGNNNERAEYSDIKSTG